MTRISSSDQVLILLREQLQRLGRGKAARAERAGRAAGGERTAPAGMARLKALAERGAIGDTELRRTLVRALLAEELGEKLTNEPALQAIVDDVFRIISETEDGRELLARALDQLRGG
jgi:hypothetical protein